MAGGMKSTFCKRKSGNKRPVGGTKLSAGPVDSFGEQTMEFIKGEAETGRFLSEDKHDVEFEATVRLLYSFILIHLKIIMDNCSHYIFPFHYHSFYDRSLDGVFLRAAGHKSLYTGTQKICKFV